MPYTAPTLYPVLYRTYSRRTETGERENWIQVADRAINGYAKVGRYLLPSEIELMRFHAHKMITMPSGRWLWVGGTPWIDNPINFSGGYNCTSTNIVDWRSFALVMDLAMQGSGTGVVLEPKYFGLLPPITTPINLEIVGEFGAVAKGDRQELTSMVASGSDVTVLVGGIGWAQTVGGKVCKITVGDSRQGWVRAYELLLEIGAGQHGDFDHVVIDISHVRPAGEPLSGFGGTANPAKLPQVFERVAKILNNAVGRQLTSLECCLLIDEAAVGIVAGGIRRSAGLRHFRHDDLEGSTAKDGLWKQDSDGAWRIDPERDALRVANHTRTFHRKPTEAECIEAVRKQFRSGEGAIQWAGEAVARSNVDLLPTRGDKVAFLQAYEAGKGAEFLRDKAPEIDEKELKHRLERYGLNPCFGAGTMIMVRKPDGDGFTQHPIESLVGKTVEVFDGEQWVKINNFRVTGRNRPMLRIELGSGSVVRTTEYHDFFLEDGTRKQAGDLEVGDRLLHMTDDEDGNDLGWFYTVAAIAPDGIDAEVYCCTVPTNNRITLASGLITGQCAEILGSGFHCNLGETHLNQLDPKDIESQRTAFRVAGLSVATLLHHEFQEERYQYSRSVDPIVGVSFTGLFDFFVKAFGVDWLRWWEAGRPGDWDGVSDEGQARMAEIANGFADWGGYPFKTRHAAIYLDLERRYLNLWRDAATKAVWEYCDRSRIRRPNRCTTVQPSGTKSLLTGASPGWHPPKAARFIRRITFRRNDPVALACIDYGYNVVPSQSDKDDNGNLLNDPFDPRCTEWLVEIPVAVGWADLPGADTIAIEQFSALAQFDFYMQVQTHYATHNVSATIELREPEIEPLARRIHRAIENDEGYISAALLARFDDLQTFPRLPFEPISRETYETLQQGVLARRVSDDFDALLAQYDGANEALQGPAPCDGDKCLLPEATK